MSETWDIKTLGDVCDVLDSKRKPITKKDRKSGEYPYYGATGIVDYVADYIFDERLVLIGEDGAKWESGDKTAFIVDGKYWVNNHAHVLRPHDGIVLHEWIEYYFFIRDLSEHITGVTVPKLNQAKLRSIKIPVPPISEQKRVVKILDEKFEAIEKLKKVTEEQIKDAKELFVSKVSELFSDQQEWESEPLSDVCTELFAGGDVPKDSHSKEPNEKYKIPIFSNGEKNKGLYGYTNKARVTEPSLTISARGTIGYSEIRNEPFYPAVRLIVATPDREKILLDFLQYFVKTLDFTHSGTSIPQLTVPMLKDYKISYPSILEQKKIVKQLDILSKKTEELKSLYGVKISDLEELKKSYLEQAFAGKL